MSAASWFGLAVAVFFPMILVVSGVFRGRSKDTHAQDR